jgi:hypothetical protein
MPEGFVAIGVSVLSWSAPQGAWTRNRGRPLHEFVMVSELLR